MLREGSANGAGGAGERQIAGFGGRQGLQAQYRSIVCSTAEDGLAELGRAIEELAAAADMARDAPRPGPPAPPGYADDQSGPDAIMTRLALFRTFRYRLDNAVFLHPLMVIFWAWIMLRSVWFTGVRKQIRWRGRMYDAAQTRFGAER